MTHDDYPDELIREVLTKVRTIALVGASNNPARASHQVMGFLQAKGYRVIPVNPGLAGGTLLGEAVYASLADLSPIPDIVDIFRNSADAGPIVEQAASLGIPYIWMQLGVRNDASAAKAEALGAIVIMDRCPKIDHPRLFGVT